MLAEFRNHPRKGDRWIAQACGQPEKTVRQIIREYGVDWVWRQCKTAD